MRNRYLFIADVLAVMLAAWAAFSFRFGWLFFEYRREFIPFLWVSVGIKIAAFLAFGLYRRYWRYGGFWDLMAVVLANVSASTALGAVMVGSRMLGLIPGFSRAVPPVDLLFSLALTLGIRASVRAISEAQSLRTHRPPTAIRRVLIVGAGDAGTLIAREMQRNPELGQEPVGFLDDDPEKALKHIHGLPVLGPLASLAEVVAERQVEEVVIAIPAAGGRTVRDIAERCQAHNLPSRVMPGLYELLGGAVSVNRLRTVDIADLLRRPQVHALDASPDYLMGASVVITGAGGSIGAELCRQVAYAGPSRILLIGHGENSIFDIAAELRGRFPTVRVQSLIADVRDRDRIFHHFRTAAPDVVFHAAAHKHVALMEDNAAEAVTNNIIGTRNVVDAAVDAGVQRLVMISTDKAASPRNMMGASKRVAELIVQRAARIHGRAFAAVRFGNVLGSRGSVVPIFKAQIERGGPVTVTHPDVRRYFMTIPEAVHLVLQAGGIGTGGELFVLDMGEPVLLREMAADMIRLSGLSVHDVPIVFTGLKPGEKLDELLWEEGAEVLSTSRPDIRLVREPLQVTEALLAETLDRLTRAAARDDRAAIVDALRACVPTIEPALRVSPPAPTSAPQPAAVNLRQV